MIKFSIVLPVYNVELYLERCLDSIINQTYTNLEIIIINDCSPDNSQAIIDKYASIDKRIRAIIHSENKGLGGARNTGIDVASGEYISFIDSDDYIELDMFEKLNQALIEKKFDIIKFGRVEHYSNKSIVLTPKLSKVEYKNGWESIKESLYNKKYKASACENIYKLDFIRKNHLLFKERLLYEDMYFTFLCHILANSILILDNPFYHYIKIREDSIINTISTRNSEVIVTVNLIANFLKENSFNNIYYSHEYHWLIYEWVCYGALYKTGKTAEDTKNLYYIRDKIRNDKEFIFTLNHLMNNSRKIKHKLPIFILKRSLFVFDIFIKLYKKIA